MPILASLEILHPLPESNSMESVQSDILILRSASDKILLLTREKNQKVCLSLFGQNTEVKNILDSISSIRSDCKPRNGAVIIDEFYVQSLRDSVGGQTKYVKLTLSYKDTSKTIHRDAIFPLLSHGNSQEVGL